MGSPYGGTAILWKKDLGGCRIIDTEDSRLMCIEFLNDGNALLFINIYMPCDKTENLDDFLYYLAKVNSIIDGHPCAYSCIMGDFNTNLVNGSNSHFGEELIKFCESENFIIADKCLCDKSTFTFFSESHNSLLVRSCHCI